uniref:Uncharacterized protein n=1 Tax=Actinoplanes garbadinensis TaxID=69485 RepID=C4NFG9_ACTGA|nr:hypothetical protein [Actinoplanes garbadinensis]
MREGERQTADVGKPCPDLVEVLSREIQAGNQGASASEVVEIFDLELVGIFRGAVTQKLPGIEVLRKHLHLKQGGVQVRSVVVRAEDPAGIVVVGDLCARIDNRDVGLAQGDAYWERRDDTVDRLDQIRADSPCEFDDMVRLGAGVHGDGQRRVRQRFADVANLFGVQRAIINESRIRTKIDPDDVDAQGDERGSFPRGSHPIHFDDLICHSAPHSHAVHRRPGNFRG